MRDKYYIWIYRTLIVVILCGVWEYVGRTDKNFFFILASPSSVIRELILLILNGNFFYHMFITGAEASTGLVAGTIIGTVAGLSLWYSKTVAHVVRPFILGLGTFSVFAFAPLMIIWFGIGFMMKFALAFFASLFVAFGRSYEGSLSVSEEYIDSLKAMKADKSAIFTKVVIPGSLDYVFSNMGVNVGLALLGAFIGEFIAAEEGLGYVILRAGNVYDVPKALAATMGIIALAILFEWVSRWVQENRFIIIQYLSVPRAFWRG